MTSTSTILEAFATELGLSPSQVADLLAAGRLACERTGALRVTR